MARAKTHARTRVQLCVCGYEGVCVCAVMREKVCAHVFLRAMCAGARLRVALVKQREWRRREGR